MSVSRKKSDKIVLVKIYRVVPSVMGELNECVGQTMFVSAPAISVLESPFVKSAVEEFVLAALTTLYNSPESRVISVKLGDGTQQSVQNLMTDEDTI